MRRAARTDGTQEAIVKALRGIGCTVHYIKEPVDLVVALKGRNVLLEVKNPEGAWRLTEQQKKFFRDWAGEAYIVEDEGQALRAMLKK